MRTVGVLLIFCWRVLFLVGKHSYKRVRKLFKREARVELRDALTGEKMGMTKKEYQRYMLALGTKDQRQIMKAKKEIQARKRAVDLCTRT